MPGSGLQSSGNVQQGVVGRNLENKSVPVEEIRKVLHHHSVHGSANRHTANVKVRGLSVGLAEVQDYRNYISGVISLNSYDGRDLKYAVYLSDTLKYRTIQNYIRGVISFNSYVGRDVKYIRSDFSFIVPSLVYEGCWSTRIRSTPPSY